MVKCLQEYERRAFRLRGQLDSQLLISFRYPHKLVSSPTLPRWVREVMRRAGIIVRRFGAHSARGAMAFKAEVLGGSLGNILAAADWSADSVFKKFYFKPIECAVKNIMARL